MKRFIVLLIALSMTLLIMLFSCGDTSTTPNGNTPGSQGESTNETQNSNPEDTTDKDLTVTVSFDCSGGTEISSISVLKGEKINAPIAPNKFGYTFDGWYLGESIWSFDTEVTEDICLKASFAPISYTITFVGAGAGDNKAEYTVEDEIVLKPGEVSSDDYFLAWYADESLTEKVTKIEKGTTENITLYAKKEKLESELKFGMLSINSTVWTVVGVKDTTVKELYIPNEYRGYPVTEIEDNAFYDCKCLEKVEIANGIIEIGSAAFIECTSLKSVKLPNTLRYIGEYAFYGCTGLRSIVIPPIMSRIEYGAFFECDKLVEVYNLSGLEIVPGSDEHGGVAKYATNVYTSLEEGGNQDTPHGDFEFAEKDGEYYLFSYKGSKTDVILPQSYNGNSYKIPREKGRG